MTGKPCTLAILAALPLSLSAPAFGDYVTVHMSFTGHFTGTFAKAKGKGQPIAFNATDLVRVENGRITDNWHIEDNLTLLQEMGVAKVKS